MFERVARHDAKSVGVARDALETLFICGVDELLAIALDKYSLANAWAAKLLALIGKWIEHFDEKICEASEVYRQEKSELAKLIHRKVWLAKGAQSPLYRAIKRELWHCLSYRGELISPRYQPDFPKKEYLPFLKLPKLSPESWREWDEPLWELVQKHNLDLLDELRGSANRSEESWTYKDGLSKREVKPRRLYWNAFQGQFRKHLKAIAQRWCCNS